MNNIINALVTPTILTGSQKLKINLSIKVKDQFPKLSLWEKFFVQNYYEDNRLKTKPTNKESKHKDVKNDIENELANLRYVAIALI